MPRRRRRSCARQVGIGEGADAEACAFEVDQFRPSPDGGWRLEAAITALGSYSDSNKLKVADGAYIAVYER